MGSVIVLTDFDSIDVDSYPDGVNEWGSQGDLAVDTELVGDVSELKDGRVRIEIDDEYVYIPSAEIVAYHG